MLRVARAGIFGLECLSAEARPLRPHKLMVPCTPSFMDGRLGFVRTYCPDAQRALLSAFVPGQTRVSGREDSTAPKEPSGCCTGNKVSTLS